MICSAVALCWTTSLMIKKLKQIVHSTQDLRAIMLNMIIFLTCFLIRTACGLMVHALKINIEMRYDENFLEFNLFTFTLWIISELVPILHLYKIHY